MSYLTIVTAPAKLPVEVAEMKEHLRVSHDLDDVSIRDAIQAARAFLEQPTQLSLITTVWRLTLDSWPRYPLELPRAPLQTVDAVKYYDTANVQQTLATSAYYVALRNGLPGVLGQVTGETWPAVYVRPDTIQIDFTAGYGDDSTAVHPLARMAVKLLAAHWFENREAVVTGTISKEVELSIHTLMRALSMGFVAGADLG